MRSNIAALALGILAIAASPAMATVVQVGDVAGMTQGAYTLDNLDDLTFVPGFTASSASGLLTANSDWAPAYHSGSAGLATGRTADVTPLTLSFATPTSSVGLWFGNDDACCETAFEAAMDIFGAGGRFIDTIAVAANMNDAVDQFIGFVSDEAIWSVTMRYGGGVSGGPYAELFVVVDDLMFNSVGASAVPLPAAAPLLIAGLGGLAMIRRRRRA